MKSQFLVTLILLTVFTPSLVSCQPKSDTPISREETGYKVSVCDWMLLKRQKLGVFELARELGSDGVELDMGSLGSRDSFDNKLREPHFQELFKEKMAEFDMEISSIAMSGFYGQSLLNRDNYRELIQDCLGTMKVMGVSTAFLPLGVSCNLTKNPELRPAVVERLKVIGEMAEKDSLIIGIETSLDAAGEISLLDEINSPSIKIYYKFQNALESGRDLISELKLLGKDRICMIHCTDTDGVLLAYNQRLDMPAVKAILDEMGWCGWLVVERSRDAGDIHNVKENYGSNIAYLKSVFQP